MAEWSKAPDSKSGLGQPNGGSNPSLSATAFFLVCWTALALPLQAVGQSRDPDVAFQRGVNLQEAGRFAEAIKAYDEAIQIGSNYLVAYNNRGAAYGALKQYERAIPDFDLAIQLNPRYTEAYCNRGAAYGALKQYERAMKDFDQAIQLDPKYARAYNNLAWLLATAEDASIRNGRRATELALKACALSDCQDAYLLDTLAAAYARVGDFAKAIEWQTKAMANPLRARDKDSEARLQSYREGKAWPPN